MDGPLVSKSTSNYTHQVDVYMDQGQVNMTPEFKPVMNCLEVGAEDVTGPRVIQKCPTDQLTREEK